MATDQNFTIGEISSEFHRLLQDIKETLSNFDPCLLTTLENKFSEIEKTEALKIALVGQYSAGKSTIISAITGNKNIKIDSDIATDKTTDYRWNNIILTDTPGLYTDRPDHDQITNEKIKESDLLVYCLTSDLFDNIVLNNFKKLAFDSAYKHKIMIVVNKMSMEKGEYDDLVRNYRTTLNKSLKPYNFSDFQTCYIDAFDYIEGVDEDIQELKVLSHFSDFTHNLNEFVATKGLLGKLDTPFRIALSTIDSTIIQASSKDDTELFQALERIEYCINKNKEQTEATIKLITGELALRIIKRSHELTSNIGQEGFNIEEESKIINHHIEVEAEQTRNEIQSLLEQQTLLIKKQIEDILESDLGTYVFNSINNGKIKLGNEVKENMSGFLNGFGIIKSVGGSTAKYLGEITGTAAVTGFAKASQVAGTQGHNFVLSIGHFFGASFKPWQAVNIAKNIGNIAKIFGVVMSVVGLFIEISDANEEDENSKKIARAKRECYDQFLLVASEIENKFIENFDSYKKLYYIKVLDQIRAIRSQIIEEKAKNNQTSKTLQTHKSAIETLLNRIYV